MPFINTGDMNIHYIENGTQGGLGAIIFVHGNWATSSWWEPVLASPLTKPWRGIAYDVRGRGRTTGPDSDYSIPSLAADLGSFIDALGIAAPHLVGHSLGSAIVMQFALDHPAKVRSLTVAAPAWVDGMPNPPGTVERQRKLKDDGAAFYEAIGLPPKTWSSLNGNRTTGREPGSDSCENDPDRTRSRLSSATSKPISTPA